VTFFLFLFSFRFFNTQSINRTVATCTVIIIIVIILFFKGKLTYATYDKKTVNTTRKK